MARLKTTRKLEAKDAGKPGSLFSNRPFPEPVRRSPQELGGGSASGRSALFNRHLVQRDLATFEQVNAADTSDHPILENRKLNTRPEAVFGVGSKAKGLGTKTDFMGANLGLTTDITWDPVETDDKGNEEGTGMTANPLGPDHKRGSAPGTNGDWVGRRTRLSGAAKKHKYIAGHLLNHNLGGPGNVTENLAAIPDEINKAHSRQIEEPVKAIVNEQGGWGKYTVSIKHDKDPITDVLYASRLTAQWVPYGLKRKQDPSTLEYSYSFKAASGEQIAVDLPIQPPSSYSQKGDMAKIAKPTNTKVVKKRTPIFTPFGFDELALTPNTSLIVQFGIQNVLLIKELKKKNEDVSGEADILKRELAEFEEKLAKLEEEKSDLEEQFEEQEVEHWLQSQKLKAERALTESLTEQVERLKERLEKTQSLGLILTSFGFGSEVTKLLWDEGALNPFLSMEEEQAKVFETTTSCQFIMTTPKVEIVNLKAGDRVEELPASGPKSVLYQEVKVLTGDFAGRKGSVRIDLLREVKS